MNGCGSCLFSAPWSRRIDRARRLLPEDELDWLVVFWAAGVIIAEIGTREGGGTEGLCCSMLGEGIDAGIEAGIEAGEAVGTWIRGPYIDSLLMLAPAAAASAFA